MPKLILKFDMYAEEQAFKDALNGDKYKSVISDVRSKLIEQSESDNLDELYGTPEHVLDSIVDMINEELKNRGLLDEMV